jgi:hypothetical protein
MTKKDRHHGGQEPPDELQDRPEQNAVYDAIVRGDASARDVDLETEDAGDDIERVPPAPPTNSFDEIDQRAERDAAKEVRRRERRNP